MTERYLSKSTSPLRNNGRPLMPEVKLMSNNYIGMMVSNEERLQHMEDGYFDEQAKLGWKFAHRRNPERHVTTNAFWKVSPNKMKVELYGDICNESNLIDCFRVR